MTGIDLRFFSASSVIPFYGAGGKKYLQPLVY